MGHDKDPKPFCSATAETDRKTDGKKERREMVYRTPKDRPFLNPRVPVLLPIRALPVFFQMWLFGLESPVLNVSGIRSL